MLHDVHQLRELYKRRERGRCDATYDVTYDVTCDVTYDVTCDVENLKNTTYGWTFTTEDFYWAEWSICTKKTSQTCSTFIQDRRTSVWSQVSLCSWTSCWFLKDGFSLVIRTETRLKGWTDPTVQTEASETERHHRHLRDVWTSRLQVHLFINNIDNWLRLRFIYWLTTTWAFSSASTGINEQVISNYEPINDVVHVFTPPDIISWSRVTSENMLLWKTGGVHL